MKIFPATVSLLYLTGWKNLPEDLRVAYKILKNAGILPEEMESRKEIVSLQNLIQACHDDAERSELTRKLNEKELRLNMIMEKRKREIPRRIPREADGTDAEKNSKP